MVGAGRTDRKGGDVVNQSRSKGGIQDRGPEQGSRTGVQNRSPEQGSRTGMSRTGVQNRGPEQGSRTGMSKPVTSWLKKKTRTRKSLGRGRRKNGWDPEQGCPNQ